MRKWLCLLLALTFILTLAAGCTQTGSGAATTAATTTKAAASGDMTGPGEFPITKQVTQLKVLTVPSTYVENYETNHANLWLEELTNIDVVWNLVSPTDASTKINLLLAANDPAEMPDVFYTGIGRSTAEAYGAQGVLLPLEGYIKDYGVNMKALFLRKPELENQFTAYDGHIYFLSRYYETVHVRATEKLWIDMAWLDTLGLEVPKTTDDFYNVLKAFKEEDANGNGDKNDEIPFIAYTGGYNAAINNLGSIFNAFVFYTPSGGYYIEDGKITVPYVQEGYREALRYLKKLYDEQLLDNECFSMTIEQAKALGAADKGNRIGAVQGGTVGVFNMDDPTIYDFEVIEPLAGPTGLKQTALEIFNPTPFFMITSYCKIPEIAYRWADAQFYDSVEDIKKGDFTWLNYWYGEEGVGWEQAKEGDVGFTGSKAYYKWLFNWGETLNTHIYETFLINMPEEWKNLMTAAQGTGYNQEQILYNATKDKMLPFAVDKAMPTLSLKEEETLSIADIATTLATYRDESMAKFIRGELSLDKDWDTYLKEIDSIGLPKVLEVYQTAYDRTFK